MLHSWLAATDGTGSTVKVALLDFRKAFDLVDHNLLITKLINYGSKPSVTNWITDFLRKRTQRIKLPFQCTASPGWGTSRDQISTMVVPHYDKRFERFREFNKQDVEIRR